MIRAYKGIRPALGARAYVDPSAQVIGAVELGEDASVWMNTVVRGDVNRIRVGARTNIQDNCVLHVTAQHPTVLAEDVTVGHEASVSKVGEEQLFYLMSRGLTAEQAATMVVSGFIEPLVKELPMEYAIEMNRLIQLQMEGSIG